LTDQRIIPPASTNHPPPLDKEQFADAVERVLARLREARPHLEGRIDRAATYLVVQLASPTRSRPIRCRIRKDGKRVYLVDSASSAGVVYEVDPGSWGCTCRDFFRRGAACKHSLSCWTLASANTQLPKPEPSKKGCGACLDGWVHKSEEVLDPETGEVTTYQDRVRCLRCAPVGPDYMTADEQEEWMGNVRWRYARSMPNHPHSYTLREWNDEETFLRVVRTVWGFGYDRPYLGRLWRSLDIGERHYVWVCTPPRPGRAAPLDATELVNRAVTRQTELLERGGA
jgi:hypothetical protein